MLLLTMSTPAYCAFIGVFILTALICAYIIRKEGGNASDIYRIQNRGGEV